jgi:hypothetical protein
MARPRTMTKDVERENVRVSLCKGESVCMRECVCKGESVCERERERKTSVGVKWR